MSHSGLWAFIRLGDGNPGEAYEARWVAECMAGGDIVIPYSRSRSTPTLTGAGARMIRDTCLSPSSRLALRRKASSRFCDRASSGRD